MIKKTIDKILDLLFPEKCFGCGTDKTQLCPDCIKKLPPAPYRENNIWAATSYQSQTIRKTVKALKYKKSKRVAEPLAELISVRLFSIIKTKEPAIIIPAPLSKRRLRQRDFNQAELIAQHLSDKIEGNFNVCNNVLYKNRDTISQVEIRDRAKRLQNLKGAFRVKNAEQIAGKTIFVLDDVSTTGATINEARRALKKAGAKEVIGLVVAR